MSTLQIILYLVCHKPTKWDRGHQCCYIHPHTHLLVCYKTSLSLLLAFFIHVQSWRPLSRVTWRLPFQSLLHWGVEKSTTPFPGLLHFNLDPYLIMPSVKQDWIKYHFLSLWYDSTWDWTQPPSPLTNTLLIWPMKKIHLDLQLDSWKWLAWYYLQWQIYVPDNKTLL